MFGINVAWKLYRKRIQNRYLARSPCEAMSGHGHRPFSAQAETKPILCEPCKRKQHVATRFSPITREEEILANVGWKVWLNSNLMPHCAKWCSTTCCAHNVGNVVPTCCLRLNTALSDERFETVDGHWIHLKPVIKNGICGLCGFCSICWLPLHFYCISTQWRHDDNDVTGFFFPFTFQNAENFGKSWKASDDVEKIGVVKAVEKYRMYET